MPNIYLIVRYRARGLVWANDQIGSEVFELVWDVCRVCPSRFVQILISKLPQRRFADMHPPW